MRESILDPIDWGWSESDCRMTKAVREFSEPLMAAATEPLTPDAIRALPAGREIESLIARLVMGWEFAAPRHGSCCCCSNCGRYYDDCGGSCEFSREIEAAMAVLCKARGPEGRPFHVSGGYTPGRYDCQIAVPDATRPSVIAWGETISLAICRAALLLALEESK